MVCIIIGRAGGFWWCIWYWYVCVIFVFRAGGIGWHKSTHGGTENNHFFSWNGGRACRRVRLRAHCQKAKIYELVTNAVHAIPTLRDLCCNLHSGVDKISTRTLPRIYNPILPYKTEARIPSSTITVASFLHLPWARRSVCSPTLPTPFRQEKVTKRSTSGFYAPSLSRNSLSKPCGPEGSDRTQTGPSRWKGASPWTGRNRRTCWAATAHAGSRCRQCWCRSCRGTDRWTLPWGPTQTWKQEQMRGAGVFRFTVGVASMPKKKVYFEVFFFWE